MWNKWHQINETSIQKQKLFDSINGVLPPPLPQYFIPIKQPDPLGLRAELEKHDRNLALQAIHLKSDLKKLDSQLAKLGSQTLYENNHLAWRHFAIQIGFVLLTILFGFRYFLNAIRWSIKTLKTK